jgi:hypothetical protein
MEEQSFSSSSLNEQPAQLAQQEAVICTEIQHLAAKVIFLSDVMAEAQSMPDYQVQLELQTHAI